VNSLVSSGKYITENPAGASEIGATFLSQEVDVIKRVLNNPGRVTFNELYPVISDFEYIQTYLTETIQAMSDKVDLNKLIDTQFAREAGAK
jgi:NitT/TauT family transport system substrate-binding protein